ncbi:SMP-30/gluconolactonase/LRE family protein [Aurantimonas aggregata]|uniref:SMP-30/gluconolactonase/LRE family protein n=1 Tax=Aurantimonas aggregata TaxID=2047720 RepID=A0A6L9MLF0_9HYPH|nr:SMP-30/gluconolactonase/LRE family protein [Aurantimonas aggregata]NDV88466.1 SMP-30/gluconolactonase/LRE family protein [Aurantimonas aggregata]
MTDVKVGVFSSIACRLGEGATYDPATGTAWWFDIEGKALLEKPTDADEATVHPLPFMASVLAVIDGDRQLMAAQDGLYVRDRRSGRLSLHRPMEAENAATRSNDGRVHPSGALWVGTMGIDGEAGLGAIYWYRAGEMRQLYPGIGIPNSICFSPDGCIAYFTDTKNYRLMRVDIDPDNGLPIGEPQLFFDHTSREGGIDGSVCDAEGQVWNARWGSGMLDTYAPGGTRIGSIAIGASRVTCPAFVGQSADRLIVTSAWSGLSDAERREDPDAGKTFVLDLPVKGRHEPKVLL